MIRGAFSQKRKDYSQLSPFIQKMLGYSLFSLKEGMETLTTALENGLKEHIIVSNGAKALHFQSDGIEIELSDGTRLKADHLYSTLPAAALATLLAPHTQALGKKLKSIPAASLAVVNLGYRSPVLKKRGFGYLIPSSEKQEILGVVWDSCVFPQQNRDPNETRLTVMMGGAHQPQIVSTDDSQIMEIALDSLSKHLGVDAEPDAVGIKRITEAIPQYVLGHIQKVKEIEAAAASLSDRLTILGSSFYGVSVNDCIAKAKEVVLATSF